MIEQGQLIYIEHKSGHHDAGPAWITRARLSKSGRTVYFNGRALKRRGRRGVSGNYCCLETADEFWISGVKVEGDDRHWAGHGPVMVDQRVVEDYLALRGLSSLDPIRYPVVSDIKDTDPARFHELENRAR
jgi:hypothetical protein